jgi:transcriptional regulator with XRE-family HTH domain
VQGVQKHLGVNIRRIRTEKGFTQDAFADRAGLNRSHMGEIERGESNVTIQTLKIIADALKVKIVDLVAGL